MGREERHSSILLLYLSIYIYQPLLPFPLSLLACRPLLHMMMMKTDYEDDADTRNGGGANKKLPTSKAIVAVAGGGDGASIEVVRRPRGRPPGSKNKPKPPIIITREAESAMRPYILEVPAGQDVVAAVTQYARRKALGLCILAGSGAVANVTLRQPGPSPAGPTVTFHGRFDILSISATFLPPSSAAGAPSAPPNGFSISLAGAQGQIVGGSVVGALMAVGTVVVVAAVFGSPTYHRLPVEEETSGAGGPSPASEAAEQQQAAAEGCGMSLYSGHMPADVIWAPPTRPPHPPY